MGPECYPEKKHLDVLEEIDKIRAGNRQNLS